MEDQKDKRFNSPWKKPKSLQNLIQDCREGDSRGIEDLDNLFFHLLETKKN